MTKVYCYWFPSNTCHHSNGYGQPLFYVMSIILKPIQTLYDEIPCGGFGQHNLHNLYAKL